MYRLVVLTFAIVAVTCQQQEGGRRVPKYAGDPKIAAILQEARYLSGNGAFGAAYQQEDGIDFKEETDANGDRKGSYSYIDPSGQRKTVHYTAGKNGFQATGDHIPSAPLPAAPVPQYKPDPRYNPPDYQAPQQYSAPATRNYAKPDEDDGEYHPELYEQDNYVSPPAQQQYRAPQPQAQPQQQYQQQPQYQPQQQYQPQPQYQQQQQQQPQYQPQNIYPGVQQAQYSGVQQQQQYTAPAARQQYYDATTPPPTRFFPPGKFSLNRQPDGFTYTFSKA